MRVRIESMDANPSMIVRVSQEDVPTLLQASGKKWAFRETNPKRQSGKQAVNVRPGENYMIWMPEHALGCEAEECEPPRIHGTGMAPAVEQTSEM